MNEIAEHATGLPQLTSERLGQRSDLSPAAGAEMNRWYAVQTRHNHEKKVATELAKRSVTAFVPTVRDVHTWSDRRKVVEVPVFTCYVFVQVPRWQLAHTSVLHTPGVFRWVGLHGEPTAIPDAQIECVRRMVSNGLSIAPHPFLKIGQRVRIRGGCLDGVEGILMEKNKDRSLVISIDLIQQSIAVAVDGYDVEVA